MAIQNYADLVRVVKGFSHRTDLKNNVDDFIYLAEDRIDQELVMRSNEVRSTTTATVNSRFLPLPDKFYKMRALSITKDSDSSSEIEGYVTDCKYKPPQTLNESIRTYPGRPRYFTVTQELEFEQPFDYAYTIEMSYFSRLEPLNDVNTTNNVLTNYPTLYLFGCMLFLSIWEKDNEETAKYESLFQAALMRANKQEKRGRYGPAPRMVPQGPTP